jgi:nucleoside phosphorylase
MRSRPASARAVGEDDDGDEPYVVVHRGKIASGEVVMKNGVMRDALASDLGVLCFEMEAAGALSDFA